MPDSDLPFTQSRLPKSLSFFKTVLLLICFSPVLIKCAPMRTAHFPTSALDQARSAYTPLQTLKIEATKRALRIASLEDQDVLQHPSIYKSYEANRFSEIVEAFQTLPEQERSAELLLIHGNALFFLGRNEAAIAAYQEAYKTAATEQEKSAAMANFGMVLSKAGKPQAGVEWLARVLRMERERDDWQAQGQTLSLLGNLYFQLGDTEKGAAAHIEALEIAETVPVPWLQAQQLHLLAMLYYLDGTDHIARDYYQKALEIYRRLGDPLGEADAMTGLAFIEKDREAFDRALDQQKAALSIYRLFNDFKSESKAMVNLVLIHRDKGDFQAALDMGRHVLAIHEKAGNKTGLAEIEGTIGTVYEKKGDLDRAIRHLEKARRLFQEAGASQQIHIVELRIQRLQDRLE